MIKNIPGELPVTTWHAKYQKSLTPAQRLADIVASFVGSWTFIILQSVLVIMWIILNVAAFVYHWDPYPFILLNLLFSTQAAYTAPVIMMSQNRQSERDRHQAMEDYEVNLHAKKEIEHLQIELSRIEDEKLNKIITILEK